MRGSIVSWRGISRTAVVAVVVAVAAPALADVGPPPSCPAGKHRVYRRGHRCVTNGYHLEEDENGQYVEVKNGESLEPAEPEPEPDPVRPDTAPAPRPFAQPPPKDDDDPAPTPVATDDPESDPAPVATDDTAPAPVATSDPDPVPATPPRRNCGCTVPGHRGAGVGLIALAGAAFVLLWRRRSGEG